jgi:hypothetical protein
MWNEYDPDWDKAVTVVQQVKPPFISENADAMTIVVE